MKPEEQILRDRQCYFGFFFSPEVCQEPALVGRSALVPKDTSVRRRVIDPDQIRLNRVSIVGSCDSEAD